MARMGNRRVAVRTLSWRTLNRESTSSSTCLPESMTGEIATDRSNEGLAMFRIEIATRFALALALAPAPVLAARVCSEPLELAVPQSGEGLYINLVTGVSGESEAQVPGFDVDPYAAQNSEPAHQLKFYWGVSSNGGAGVASSGDTYAVLQPGASIGPDSLFTRAAFTGDTSAWQAGVAEGYLGMRFTNEATGLLNYGWLRLRSSAPLGFPLTVVQWCYDDSGDALTIAEPATDEVFCDGFEDVGCAID
jgi:hypothetical protein